MPVLMIHESPGGTREQYEEVGRRLTDGRGLDSLDAWPAEGILSHVAGPIDGGWRVIDVWESEEAFHRFGGTIGPILEEVGFPGEPRLFSIENFVKQARFQPTCCGRSGNPIASPGEVGMATPKASPAEGCLRPATALPFNANTNTSTIAGMMLADRSVPDDDVRELARLVDEPTRGVLEQALELKTAVLALSIDDRTLLLWALDDPKTTPLAELRATLLLEHEGRVRDGLI